MGDPYLEEFAAKVSITACNKLVLDQVCFFPHGGKQVGDTGEISGINVIDTRKGDDLTLILFSSSELGFKVGDVVPGANRPVENT